MRFYARELHQCNISLKTAFDGLSTYLARCRYRLGKNLIQQKVNQYACDGDIHPQGPGNLRQFLMLFETTFHRVAQSHENQWHNHNGED